MRYQVLQHVSFETCGLLEELIRGRGHSLRTTALYNNEALPTLSDFDVLIIMGGPMSIHDEAAYPWLRAEKDLIATALEKGKKLLGICLGAQLIAAVCGAKVYPNPQKEIGFWPVRWTTAGKAAMSAAMSDRGPSGRDRPAEPETLFFHWHGETFDLPEGATLLASSDACVNQAFMLGDRVVGIQFHPELTPGILRAMIHHEGWELVTAPYIQSAGQILAQTPHSTCMSFLINWL